MIEYPTIPERIVIHLGAPSSNAENVTETFANYIKNVASSEIYPTWPEEAIRANILAEISVALNRYYTQYYRSAGYDFDITSSPAYDQNYVYQRDIFDNISDIVDEIFDSYIRRENNIEPLFAAFCDGVEVQCEGLSQWGSVSLANEGLDALSILRRYYGENIELIENVPIDNELITAPSAALREGDTGRDVEILQRRLNRISANYPGIPKITPADGFFDSSTVDAVKKFQEVFNLTPDGIVGRATWYRVQAIYNAVKKLAQLNSEGLRISELSTQQKATLKEGDASVGVLVLQYYLSYISGFVPTVVEPTVDGTFGPLTRESVISLQKTYGLDQTGEVNRAVWEVIENVYYGLIDGIEITYRAGEVIPFPGRVLRVGVEGEDVRVLQEYLSYIASRYTDIPSPTPDGIFGSTTDAAVRAFVSRFDLPTTPGRVNAVVWDAIASVYEDLYAGSSGREGQFPGYTIS